MNAIIAPFTKDHLAALAQKLRLWLLMGLAALAELFDGMPLAGDLRVRVRWLLADLEGGMRVRLYLLAAMDAPRVARRPRPPLPPFRTPTGVRRHTQRGNALRHFTRGLFPRATIAARIARLKHLMRTPERAMAKIRARVRRGLINGRLLLRAAARCVVRHLIALAPTCADTS